MQTVIETEIFKKAADQLLTEDERLNFISWIAVHPKSGDVIPGANGARKFDGLVETKANVAEYALFTCTTQNKIKFCY